MDALGIGKKIVYEIKTEVLSMFLFNFNLPYDVFRKFDETYT